MRPPPSWPGERPEPPEHWLERVRQGAPWLLDQLDSGPRTPRQARHPVTQPARRATLLHEGFQRLLPSRTKRRRAPAARTPSGRAAAVAPVFTPDGKSERQRPSDSDAMHQADRTRGVRARPGSPVDDLPIDRRAVQTNGDGPPHMAARPQVTGRPTSVPRALRPAFRNGLRAVVDDLKPRRLRAAEPREQPSQNRPAGTPAAFWIGEPLARPDPRQSAEPPPTQVNEWPSLPALPGDDDGDWTSTMRRWERQRRLEAEQRGEPWNARRS
jgi:hypothetical protein